MVLVRVACSSASWRKLSRSQYWKWWARTGWWKV